MKANGKQCSAAAKAWWALGGLVVVGLTIMFINEYPSLRRELKIALM